MEAWATSRKGIHFPTLSNKLALDTEMGETVISVSNTSESLSIRASSLEAGSCSVMDKMTGFMAMMKNTCESVENARVWFTVELQFRTGAFAPIFKRSNDLKYHKIMTRGPPFICTFRYRGRDKTVLGRPLFTPIWLWRRHVSAR
jgi:hypothetical protein